MIKRCIISILFIASALQISNANPQYNSSSLTPQKSENGKWGYVDDKGKYRIRPQFELAMPFREGLAMVTVFQKYGFIDPNGRPVIHPQYDAAHEFYEDLAAVMIYDYKMNCKWGFINRNGRFVISAKYDSVSDFIDGKAEVKIDNQVYTINKAGEIINPS